MFETNLIDETFDVNILNNYSLLLKFSYNNFAFTLFDNKRKKFILLKSTQIDTENTSDYINKIINIFEKDDILLNYFGKVKAVVYSRKTIIVPSAFYTEKEEKNLLEFNIKIDENEQVINNKLKNNSYNIFAINKQLVNLLNEKFNDISIYNQASVIINENIISPSKEKNKLYIDSDKDFIDVALYKKGNLLFKNTFEYKTTTDFVFHILNIFDKFELQPNKIDLVLSGEVTSISDEVTLLKNYIKKIKFAKPILNYSYTFHDIKISKYTNLLNLQNCE